MAPRLWNGSWCWGESSAIFPLDLCIGFEVSTVLAFAKTEGQLMRKLVLAGTTTLAKLGISLLVSWIAASSALGAEDIPARTVVAVIPFDSVGANQAQVSVATDRMQEELLATRRYTVVDRAQLDAILSEQALQQTGCIGTECAVRVGRILGARKLITGKVTRLDETRWVLATSLIDVESGQTERAYSVQFDGDFLTLVREGTPILAAKIAGLAPPENSGFLGQVVEAVASPLKRLSGESLFHPKSGFAVYSGYSHYSGTMSLESGGSLDYSGGGIPTYGLEYQWRWKEQVSVALFGQIASSTGPSGELSKLYNMGGPTVAGVELRYWSNRLYVGANVAAGNTCFDYYPTKRDRADRLCLNGNSFGPAAGYQSTDGWFLSGSYQFVNLGANTSRKDPRVPAVSSATEYDLWLNIGYRWGQRAD
jgi:TolB-like protein